MTGQPANKIPQPASRRLKIGLVFDDSLDRPDGVQQYLLTLGSWLASQGCEVHYLTGETTRTDVANIHSLSRNIHVNYNGNRLSIPLPVRSSTVRRLLQGERFDVLHVMMPYSPMLAARVIAAAPAGTAVVGTFHILPQTWLVRVSTHVLGWWLRRTLRRFDRVFAVSDSARAFAGSAFGLPDVRVLPNVVDLAAFQSADRADVARSPMAAATAQEPAAGGVPVVTFLGRLVPRKGCQTFIDAVAKLRRTYDKPFRAVICGRGPLEAELKQQSARLGVDDIIEFAGFVSEEDKPRYIAQSSVMAFPSTGGESFGIVLIEAMAAGRPVVLAAANPGYATVLGPRPELLFKPGDHNELAAKLAHFLSDGQDCQATVDWQRAYVHQFDVAVVGRRLLAEYNAQARKKLRS